MKKFTLPLSIGLILIVFSACSFLGTKQDKENGESASENTETIYNTSTKTLIVYFSFTGNTEKVANKIQNMTNANMFKVDPVKSYPMDHNKTVEIAMEEKNCGARPEIKGRIADMLKYDTIYLGFPIWWGTVPMAMATFMEAYNFDNKVIKPFCTHGGGGVGHAYTDVESLAPKAIHKKGLDIIGKKVDTSMDQVETWLSENK